MDRLRRKEVKEPLEDLLALPEEEVGDKIEFVAATFQEQDKSGVAYTNLRKPGRYAAVCFLPVGSTDQAAAESASGPPHFTEGMVEEFKVKRSK